MRPRSGPQRNRFAIHYVVFSITLAARFHTGLISALMKSGSLGVVENGRTLTFYFPPHVDRETITQQIEVLRQVLLASDPSEPITVESCDIPDADWNETWKKNFMPLNVGEQFTILPPWETVPPGRKGIIIDPGRAFGTGHHETTRSCLLMMEKFSPRTQLGRFLDLGTGTGLLALAASQMGFRSVEGIDTDALAIEAAQKNIELNGAAGMVHVRQGELHTVNGVYDMIAANLISGTLVRLARAISRRLVKGGIVICSGILTEQERNVRDAMTKAGLFCRETILERTWVTMACER